MKMSNNTILITGGTSGIGLELASRLLALGNTVIVTGRDRVKLESTQKNLPKVHVIQSDVSDPDAIRSLHEKVITEFPDLNVLINNAGVMRKINFHDRESQLVDLTREIDINLMGPIRMTKQFLAHLKTKKTAAIVNVSSGLAFLPLPISPVYCATKAGMHSFTQSLRVQLKGTNVKVFELAPPGTETPLFNSDFTADDLKGAKAMDVRTLGKHAIAGLENDVLEIRPGLSNVLKLMSRIAPQMMLNVLGKSAEAMLGQAKV